MNCLALTGTDSTLPLIVGLALLLCGAAAVTIVAWRRNRKAGAALLLALVLAGGGASLLVAPQPAQAATGSCEAGAAPDTGSAAGDPGTPGGPGTPDCTPADKVPDVEVDGTAPWSEGNGFATLPLSVASADTIGAAIDAIYAIDKAPTSTVDLAQEWSGGTFSLPAPGLAFTGAPSVTVSSATFDAVTAQGHAGAHVVGIESITYADGCGGTLTTDIRAVGALPPPACVPGDRWADLQLGGTDVLWTQEADNNVGITATPTQYGVLADELPALEAEYPNATQTTSLVVTSGSFSLQSNIAAPVLAGNDTVEIDAGAYQNAVHGLDEGGTVVVTWTFAYSDACGNQMTTDFTITGSFPEIPA